MGVPASECGLVAELVALKTIVNEFVAYKRLSEFIAQGLISVSVIVPVVHVMFMEFKVLLCRDRNAERPLQRSLCVASLIQDRLEFK